MPNLKQLVSSRTQLKNQLARFQDFVEEISLESEPPNELQLRIEKIELLWDKFDDVQSEIESLSDAETHKQERVKFENLYFRIMAKAKIILGKSSVPKFEESSPERNDSPSARESSGNSIPLPVISLPNFSGNYEDAIPFFELFDSMIHSKQLLSDTQKLYYLKTAVSGEAKELINTLELIPSNYQVAINLLKDTYLNSNIVVKRHIKMLLNIPRIEKGLATGLKTFLNEYNKHLRILESLKQPVEAWDSLLVFSLSEKLDPQTHDQWQATMVPDKIPTVIELTDFLKQRIHFLENRIDKAKIHSSPQNSSPVNNNFRPKHMKTYHTATQKPKTTSCPNCKGSHHLFSCQQFLNLPVSERFERVVQLKLCINCLRPGHHITKCTSIFNCKQCHSRHNTILHGHKYQSERKYVHPNAQQESNTGSARAAEQAQNCHFTSSKQFSSSQVLLSTAIVNIKSLNNESIICRALLDCGSQCSYISGSLCQALKLKRNRINIPVIGVNSSQTQVNSFVETIISSISGQYVTGIRLFVLPKITESLPSIPFKLNNWTIPDNIQLADPEFFKSSKIDLLIGADIFWNLMCTGHKTLENGSIHLVETRLGWIVSGQIPSEPSLQSTFCNFTKLEDLSDQMEAFWRIEECESTHLTGEDKTCEDIYNHTTFQDSDGRYVVKLPLREDAQLLGNSRENALKRFLCLEGKLLKNTTLQEEYCQFMKEYESLSHMTKLTHQDTQSLPADSFYIPHHAVFKESSTTTKLRVVFDASAKSDSGFSLNDIAMVGPVIQSPLTVIIMRFRTVMYAMTADIEKMYRQVKIDEGQRHLQLILWREDLDSPIETYKLNTVTYGVTSASFLATRTLIKLADDYQRDFPEASRVLKQDFYVDDYIGGANSIQEAIQLQTNLNKLLKIGQFHLRKWSCNESSVLEGVPKEDLAHDPINFVEGTISTLGLIWDPKKDTFQFNIPSDLRSCPFTKRTVLSTISKIFDPLGLIGPVITAAKILMQKIWVHKLDWDDQLPKKLHLDWNEWLCSLPDLKRLHVPRLVIPFNDCKLEIHGFSDASMEAYGCCIYLKTIKADGRITVELLSSKSRVSPIKTVSLPRLELCGAVLLVQLLKTTLMALNPNPQDIYLYTDSTIVLQWISAPSSHWNIFVANRVAKIQEISDNCSWRHVKGIDNPADCISRGVLPGDIINLNKWWHGPTWLMSDQDPSSFSFSITQIEPPSEPLPEQKICTCLSFPSSQLFDFSRFSKFNRLIRAIAYFYRAINIMRHQLNKPMTGKLTHAELDHAQNSIWKLIQQNEFFEEIRLLRKGETVHKGSKIVSLTPFIDQEGLLRVGGRLEKSLLPFNQQHPLIIPGKHHVSELLARDEHKRLLHVGPQGLLYSLRERFWPVNGRHLVSKVSKSCVKCFRIKPPDLNQLMGQLPEPRVQPSKCFLHTGVDYCGPFMVKRSTSRNSAYQKSYISVFICLATKAMHLELVEDLSTSAFMAALRRFIARRGIPSDMYSDNGTNFVGGDRELQNLWKSESLLDGISQNVVEFKINWHFIPPAAPNFGGLWESGVRSVKRHLKAIAGTSQFTFVQFTTLLAQIEAIINSRPLTPLSNNPTDLRSLSPSHFLVGESLTTLPEPNLLKLKQNRLDLWKTGQQHLQRFWHRWSAEYLNELQQRNKWRTCKQNIKIGDLVVIKSSDFPAYKWKLGRIMDLHPGRDGLVRVVTIKTQLGHLKRPISQICPLPMDCDEEEDETQ